MKRNLVCVINPIAGNGNGEAVAEIVSSAIDRNLFDLRIVFTEHAGHAREIASEAVSQGVDAVVAVGGDGTVNEIASALSGSHTALAIIPRGSGNGLAYHLGIPADIRKAVEIINRYKVERIDSATFNEHQFFCTCGVGYDAKVAMEYARAKSRGLVTYVRKTIEVWGRYKPQTFHITTESFDFTVKAFLITIGNANQWGNNYHITPNASLRDGLLDLTIIHPINLIQAIPIPVQLLDSHIYHHSKVDIMKARQVRIERILEDGDDSRTEAHYDGEAIYADSVMDIRCIPSNLDVLVP